MPTRDEDNKVSKVGYYNLTPDLRKNMGGGRVVTYRQIVSEAETEEDDTGLTEQIEERLPSKAKRQLATWAARIVDVLRHQQNETRRAGLAFLNTVGFTSIANNTWVILPYNTIRVNTDRWNTGNSRYYALKTGMYDINAAFSLTRSNPANTFTMPEIAVYKNASLYAILDHRYSETARFFLNGGITVFMNCGEYIDIRFRNADAAPYSLSGTPNTERPYGYFSVHYAGCNCNDNTGVTIPTGIY